MQDLSLVKPCWLSQITSLSSMGLSLASAKICSMTFPGTEVRLTGQWFPGSCFPTLFKNEHNGSLFPVISEFTWLPWPFKCHGEWLGNNISQFPQDSVVHLVRSPRLMYVQVPLVVTNLIFPYSGRGFTPPSCSPSTVEGRRERPPVKTEAKM